MPILQNLITKVVKRALHSSRMTNSRYEYVKDFELDDKILPSVWIVCRVDGKSFHKFADVHEFEKPNDKRGKSTYLSVISVLVKKKITFQ
jgi:tRNA(His) 5'-end guanylyltransferase